MLTSELILRFNILFSVVVVIATAHGSALRRMVTIANEWFDCGCWRFSDFSLLAFLCAFACAVCVCVCVSWIAAVALPYCFIHRQRVWMQHDARHWANGILLSCSSVPSIVLSFSLAHSLPCGLVPDAVARGEILLLCNCKYAISWQKVVLR